jgi:hypothetical protein
MTESVTTLPLVAIYRFHAIILLLPQSTEGRAMDLTQVVIEIAAEARFEGMREGMTVATTITAPLERDKKRPDLIPCLTAALSNALGSALTEIGVVAFTPREVHVSVSEVPRPS